MPVLSYWTFSDIFEEQGQQAPEFSQAFGTRTFHGIPKPVYRGLQLVHRLHQDVVAVKPTTNTTAVDVVMTKLNQSIEALLVNHPGVEPGDIGGGAPRSASTANGSASVTLSFVGEPPAGAVEVRRMTDKRQTCLHVVYCVGDLPPCGILCGRRRAR